MNDPKPERIPLFQFIIIALSIYVLCALLI